MKRIVALVAVLMVAAGAGGCDAAAGAERPAKVSGQTGGGVLKVGDQKAGSRALLAAAGLLDGTPYRIEWSEFAAGPPLLEAVNAGAVDLGAVGDTPPIFAGAAGSKIVIVAA